jgi:hypothetical protein
MSPELMPSLLETLEPAHPEIAQWLAAQGPLVDPLSPPGRMLRESIRMKRALDRRLYYTRRGFTKNMKTIC